MKIISIPEWRLIEKVARNPNLVKAFDRTLSHPPNREICHVDPVENQNVYNFNLGVN